MIVICCFHILNKEVFSQSYIDNGDHNDDDNDGHGDGDVDKFERF